MFMDSSRVKVLEVLSDKKEGSAKIKQGGKGFVVPYINSTFNVVREITMYSSEVDNKIKSPFKIDDGGSKRYQPFSNIYEYGNFLLVCDVMEVIFTSFNSDDVGKRCERKTVVNVLPVTKSKGLLTKSGLSGNRFHEKDIIKNIVDGTTKGLITFKKQVENIVIQHITLNSGNKKPESLKDSDKPDVCILVPDYSGQVKDITQHDNEYVAWCRSVLNNNLLPVYVYANTYSNIPPVNKLDRFLRDYIMEEGCPPRINVIDKAFKEDRKLIVYMLREILLTILNASDRESYNSIERCFRNVGEKADTVNVAICIGHVAWRLFSKPMQDILPIEYGRRKNLGPVIGNILKDQRELLYKSTLMD